MTNSVGRSPGQGVDDDLCYGKTFLVPQVIFALFTGHILVVCWNIVVFFIFRYSCLFLLIPAPVDLYWLHCLSTLTGGSQFSVPILFSPDQFPFRGDKLSP